MVAPSRVCEDDDDIFMDEPSNGGHCRVEEMMQGE